MKKIIAAIALIFTVGLVHAQTDTARTRFEYYPESNVYYNDAAHSYWYYDSTSSQWQSGAQLPSTYSINDKTKKNSFYYNGAEVWKENAKHMKTYGKKTRPKNPAN